MALTDNLVSYWKLDESSGNAVDSVGSNTLTNVNTVTYSTGKLNNGADFELSNSQYLKIIDASQTGLDITGDISISAWINMESLPVNNGNYEYIVSKYLGTGNQRSYGFGVGQTSGAIHLAYISCDDGSSVTISVANYTFEVGKWYHVSVTRTGTTARFYLNGILLGTATAKSSQFNSTADFRIGAIGIDAALECFDGMIDEVGIWSRALTADEVSQLYNSNRALAYPLTSPTLYGGVAYYKLDESSGNASDSINGFTLTNSNVTYGAVKINNGGIFNGSSAKFNTASNVVLPGAKSISFWHKSNSTADNQTIIDNSGWDANNHYGFSLRTKITTGKLAALIRGGGTTILVDLETSINICDNTLRFITFTWDGTTTADACKIYINGSVNAQSTATGAETTASTYTTVIGNVASGTYYWMNGNLDEIGIFNRALSVDEITALYNGGVGNQFPFTSIVGGSFLLNFI